jgi:hypothetical protein
MPVYTVYHNSLQVLGMLHAFDLKPHCKQAINLNYIKNALAEATYIVAATSSTSPRILGFAAVKARPNTLYVSVVCSKSNQGKAIMEQVAALARVLGKRAVTLEALPRVEGFYSRLGFKATASPKKSKKYNGLVPMAMSVQIVASASAMVAPKAKTKPKKKVR